MNYIKSIHENRDPSNFKLNIFKNKLDYRFGENDKDHI